MGERVYGKNIFTWVHKKSGVEQVRADDCDIGKAADWGDRGDAKDFSVSIGRTLSLAPFTFARVGIGVKFSLMPPFTEEEKEGAYQCALAAVQEVMAREEAGIRGQDREIKQIELNDLGIRRLIWLEYGQTIPGAERFESHKFDFISSEAVPDDADAENVLLALQEDLGQKVADQAALIKGEKSDPGF